MVIIVDAMGGDNAPYEIVNGCIDAINKVEGFNVLLVGDSVRIDGILKERKYDTSRVDIYHTDEVIENDDQPTRAIKTKKNSSMVMGFTLLKEKKGDVFVSAGNSGALMVGSMLILGRTKGVDRPALAAVLPTKRGNALLIDAGLNTVCRPINYLQFGIMGSIFMKGRFNIQNPRVGLLNVGSEPEKGNEVIKQSFALLSGSNLNFIGNIEGSDLPEGTADVVVCDGFVGNVVLKFLEGTASFFFDSLKKIFTRDIFSMLSTMLIQKGLKKFKNQLDNEENGGAQILGVNGLVMKSHGSSNSRTIKNVVIKASKFAQTTFLDQISAEFKNMEAEEIG